jgi:hypothetical protein
VNADTATGVSWIFSSDPDHLDAGRGSVRTFVGRCHRGDGPRLFPRNLIRSRCVDVNELIYTGCGIDLLRIYGRGCIRFLGSDEYGEAQAQRERKTCC